MGILELSGVALISVFLILLLRELRGNFALPVRLCATLVLFAAALSLYLPLLSAVRELLAGAGMADFAAPLVRGAGVALICECTASFCRDMGEGSIADGVLFFGRLEILVLALPYLKNLLSSAGELLSWS